MEGKGGWEGEEGKGRAKEGLACKGSGVWLQAARRECWGSGGHRRKAKGS